MSALTVTLGADITALKRGMAAASEVVASAARRMAAVIGAGPCRHRSWLVSHRQKP